ncbi:hypothetical protein DPMN_045039 [Dreissena polymorpha]|uniref:Uncharacterized protein n=1 Tax=Dreissena polymorpha TaxID=45954 RepID=A0A9D4D3D2_DREPO|nr:hypothetical protein DPMN_045039 [Dreissena polymorpha]
MTKTAGSEPENITPVLATILSMIVGYSRPRNASLLQKMNAVQMWRARCKRSLFQNFNKMGFSVGEDAMLSCLDSLKRTFDEDLLTWKSELQKYVRPGRDTDEEEIQKDSENAGTMLGTDPGTDPNISSSTASELTSTSESSSRSSSSGDALSDDE